jgi:hypothetical protein
MLNDERVRRCLGPGMHVAVGSADAAGRPLCCDAIGVAIRDDARVTVYLAAAIAADTLANLAVDSRVAIVSSSTHDHGTVQLKGRSRGPRPVTQAERPELEAFVEAMAQALEVVGLPAAVTRRLTRWPAFALDVDVESVFDQTPGPRAGEPVAAR